MSEIRLLALGDVVGPEAVRYISGKLWGFRREKKIDIVVCNAENACAGNGLDPQSADRLLSGGCDVLTGGNHIFRKKEIRHYLDESEIVVRPANYPYGTPGNGYTIFGVNGFNILIALGRYLDGRISAVWGTHTHVATADNQVLPKGSGYVTDLGMSGPPDGVLGIRADIIIEKLRTKLPVKFEFAEGATEVNGVIFALDTDSGKCVSTERVKF